jgi:hypothetical protein
MNLALKCKLFSLVVGIILFGCSSSQDLPTPEKIGEKERLRVITGKQAAGVVNRMHGQSVATEANVIAEYGGGEKKDILYISRYADPKEAQKAFDLMIEKMAAAKKSPFFHLMPIGKYENKVYITLGMGAMHLKKLKSMRNQACVAVHYIYPSGPFLLWLQTFQSFGDTLPPQLLGLYPL